jgi:hypothetical protein
MSFTDQLKAYNGTEFHLADTVLRHPEYVVTSITAPEFFAESGNELFPLGYAGGNTNIHSGLREERLKELGAGVVDDLGGYKVWQDSVGRLKNHFEGRTEISRETIKSPTGRTEMVFYLHDDESSLIAFVADITRGIEDPSERLVISPGLEKNLRGRKWMKKGFLNKQKLRQELGRDIDAEEDWALRYRTQRLRGTTKLAAYALSPEVAEERVGELEKIYRGE